MILKNLFPIPTLIIVSLLQAAAIRPTEAAAPVSKKPGEHQKKPQATKSLKKTTVILVKSKRSSALEFLQSGQDWRINTYWYSIAPRDKDVVMFNDANKKCFVFNVQLYRERTNNLRHARKRRAPEFNTHGEPGFFSGPRSPFTWSEWKKIGEEKLKGLTTIHYRRMAKAKRYRPPEDRAATMLQNVMPARSNLGNDRDRGTASSASSTLRNVTSMEDLWVWQDKSPQELRETIGSLFGCEWKLGLPVQNIERIRGTGSRGKELKVMKYMELTGVKTKELAPSKFHPPGGYKKARDLFSVMLDDEGAEQFIYLGPIK